ncbi:hypothetical protein DYB37_003478 [Aphanomyces astaci]|uniref:START domain-containing protein n=1 Tax=Aphanomyces astaci TaxID=112090 RepID=A0A3R6ZSQ1_APHAT|nr:hypothetical protein DYB35_004336 [Aphanomyces astaci]RHZ07645.1 hypothetical protein DYB37_003478 [Aphanomyces astaci]
MVAIFEQMNLARDGGTGGHRRGMDPIRMPRLPSISSSFPSSTERVQLQGIAEQSRRFLKRMAYSLATAKPTWDVMEADNNMELFHIKDKNSGTDDNVISVCGVAGVYGTLSEVADALFIPQTLPDMTRRGPKTFVDDILGSQTLLRVDGRTSVKWMAVQCADGMTHRDFVVLHSCERFQDVETRGVVISLHSLDFPGAPPSFETSIHSAYRFVRGGIYRSGFVLLENSSTPGIIDVMSVFKVDFKGTDVRSKLPRSATLAAWLHWMGELNKYLLCAKLRRVGAPRLRRQTAPVSTRARRQCESCDAPFKFHFRPRKHDRRQCMMCSAVLCNACTVDFSESAGTPTTVFCIPCLVKWNPDGPSIKFIQPPSTTIGSSPASSSSSSSSVQLRSQMHHRFPGDDDTLPRHTAVFVSRPNVPNDRDASKGGDDRMEQLRRHLHAAVADVVRESSRGHTAAAKQALERRNQLKRQMKHLHDCSLGGARPRGSNERSTLREDLRASQVELAALRSKHPGDGVPAFSTASIAKLNPHDIAALQAKLDGLLIFTASNKRVDMKDLNQLDDIHSFSL